MDRAKLAERNQQLTALRHRLTLRKRLRRALLRWYARLPAPRIQPPEAGLFLIIRPDHVGDVLLSTPAIQALAAARPSARLIGLVGPWAAPLLSVYPEVELVLTVPFPGFTRRARVGSPLTPYWMAWRWARQVRQLGAETAIILRPDHWWGALLAYLAGIPNRVGYDLPEVAPFLTDAIPYQERHTVLQAVGLVERWTNPIAPADIRLTFPVAEADRTYIDDLFLHYALPLDPRRPLVVMHPGAGAPLKHWPPEHWASVADRLAERLDATVIFTGNDSEHTHIWQIMALMRRTGVSLAGETSIEQLAALYERASVVIGPDTGPLHLAVASGAPTVHLFGPADPALFGPWGAPARHAVVTSSIACRPCRILDWAGDDPANHPCVRDITPPQVIEAALRAAAHR